MCQVKLTPETKSSTSPLKVTWMGSVDGKKLGFAAVVRRSQGRLGTPWVFITKGSIQTSLVGHFYSLPEFFPAYKHFTLHSGEKWRASCYTHKRVRCRPEPKQFFKKNLVLTKCFVEKTASCAHVKTVCFSTNKGCRASTRGGVKRAGVWRNGKSIAVPAPTWGKFPTGSYVAGKPYRGAWNYLPAVDRKCLPRPPLIKSKSEYCQEVIALL